MVDEQDPIISSKNKKQKLNKLHFFLFSEFTHRSVNTHLLNSVYTLLTFIFCAKPVNLFHFYQPVVYAICYSLFSVIWHYTGNDPVYDILDWDQPGPTVRTVLIVTLVGGPLLHVLVFALYTFRKWLSEQCGCTGNTQRPSEKKPQRELTSRDVELQLPHKTNSVQPWNLSPWCNQYTPEIHYVMCCYMYMNACQLL